MHSIASHTDLHKHRTSLILEAVWCLLLLGMCFVSFDYLKSQRPRLDAENEARKEALYLPNGQALKLLSFGYANLLSDILWFKTISYFGKHYSTDRNYRWLSHMCDLVLSLDARKRHVYDFCATMLSWEADMPQKSVQVLSKAIQEFPQDWRLFYTRGFTYMYFLQDSEAAKKDFLLGSKLPNADIIMARLAAKKMVDSGDIETALVFLKDALRRAQNPNERAALLKRWEQTRYELDFRNLEKALQIFEQMQGHPAKELQDLIDKGVITRMPLDPFGGKYYLDTNRKLASTSGVKRLSQYQQKTYSGKNQE